MKATSGLSVAIGWHTEAFARTKRMKPLGEYLNPMSDEDRREAGAKKVLALFERKSRETPQVARDANK